MTYAEQWDLESIFTGGLKSTELTTRLQTLKAQIATTFKQINDWQYAKEAADFSQLQQITNQLQAIEDGLKQTGSFVNMHQSVDERNQQVAPLMGQINQLQNAATQIDVQLTKKLVTLTAAEFETLVGQPLFAPIAFNLREKRTQGAQLLDEKTEHLINQLALDGLQGWSDHYDTLVAEIQIPDEGQLLSAGQAQNKFEADPDPKVRQRVFTNWSQTWDRYSPLLTDTLNHLAGFRLSDYQAHGLTDFMQKPLEYNRLQSATLKTMWQVVSQNKAPLVSFLNRKAALMGKTQLAWQDTWSPVIVGDFKPATYSYDQAAEFIIQNFKAFSPKMAAVAQQAFEKRWIEAEDRPGKQPGGYMTELPETQDFRIFMTFDGTPSGVSTLAHELGHGFHTMMLNGLPSWRQDYAMNVAETASTLAELIVVDATVQAADSIEAKINLLDQKITNAIDMFMNIHARYLFEHHFYAERQNGFVPTARLKTLMLDAQKEAYADALTDYDPLFWADKQHFFFDDVPFYNFPYTFGYLFSLGIYAKSQEVDQFEDQYIALLQDTANMTTEALAQKHLGVDLTQPAFWQAAATSIQSDIDQFMALTEAYLSTDAR
ncbi:M3 family oligoendopeptidase [Latilactobacillus fuchuensis]|jgi:pepF/M3 family oligoendopeptidase|uniref:Oligoendopeptidase, pepF/M3 family protein n=1 Tax=Latilactobacillus fuchuensis TaxID=164393 RepID=A0A2N9DSU4_9LACO|nr:M3 family oligoendopeptidase [Latilactobacillus fuchuensis]MCP8856744.1 M3 family oligoendopeptidase [Latilactobacillus fuchuensis]SPC35825.1 Oligoendopeptidase, pepF/M3 family protein [Latilactobacillus fuchuensis]